MNVLKRLSKCEHCVVILHFGMRVVGTFTYIEGFLGIFFVQMFLTAKNLDLKCRKIFLKFEDKNYFSNPRRFTWNVVGFS